MTVSGRVTHTSPHTVEVQMMVDAEHPFEGAWKRLRVAEAYFLEVVLDSLGQPQSVPSLQVYCSV